MKFVGRWLDGVSPETPVGDAARRALTQKLPVVFYYLPLAATHHEDTDEYVHQLRVATRRAVTVVTTFAPTLPKKRSAHVTKALKQIRQAAGMARELDVLHSRFQEEVAALLAAGIPRTQFEALEELLVVERTAAQPRIVEAYHKQAERGLEEKVRRLGDSIRWRGKGCEPAWGAIAHQLLRPHIQRVLKKSTRLGDAAALHAFRIAGKHLRYAMELTVGAFDDSFRTVLYPVIRDVQQRLGDVNDHVCAVAFFESLRQRSSEHGVLPETFQIVLDRESNTAEQLMNQFFQWWTAERADDFRRNLTETTEHAT